MELTVKLQVFEGPLDLLLHLLEKNKVNIYDIQSWRSQTSIWNILPKCADRT